MLFSSSSNICSFTYFKTGDHVILPNDVYGGTFRLTEDILKRFNIEFTTVDATHSENIKKLFNLIRS